MSDMSLPTICSVCGKEVEISAGGYMFYGGIGDKQKVAHKNCFIDNALEKLEAAQKTIIELSNKLAAAQARVAELEENTAHLIGRIKELELSASVVAQGKLRLLRDAVDGVMLILNEQYKLGVMPDSYDAAIARLKEARGQ
jgi:uncharacterized coiled-coil protein SlyX